MNAREGSQRVVVFLSSLEMASVSGLPVSQNRNGSTDSVPQDFEKFRGVFFQELENVARELAIMGTLFDRYEISILPMPLPDFGNCAANSCPNTGPMLR